MLRVDSTKVMPGDTFLALRGIEDDGHNYIDQAIDKGATCIIAESGEYSVKTIIEKDTRVYLAKYLNELYADKLKKIELIGITGRRGKTSSAYLTYELLNSLGYKCAYIGSLGFCLDDEKIKLKNTTPDLYELFDLIVTAVNNECSYLVMEVTEEALLQRRLEGLKFKYVAITNTENSGSNMIINELHINNLIEKVKRSGYVIINADDKSASNFIFEKNKNILYGTKQSDYQIKDVYLYEDHSLFSVEVNYNKIEINLPLACKYNIYNYLIAFIIAHKIGANFQQIILSTSFLKQVAGRFQIFKKDDNKIVVDNAYKESTIQNIIAIAREFTKEKVITIIGGKGNTDEESRKLLANLIVKLSDYVIFTTDNSYDMNPEELINNMVEDLNQDNFEVVLERKDAIKKGISLLNQNDTLLVLGRGNEDYQVIDNEKYYFNDTIEVSKYVKKNKNA